MGYVAPVIPQTESPGLADFFQGIRKEQAQRNQQRAELLLGQQRLSAETAQNQAQNDLSGRRVAVEENRAKDEQEAHKSEVAQQVTAALDAGRPDLAHQIAKRYPGLLDSITTQKPAPPPAGSGDSLLPPSIETPNPNPVPGRRTTPADSAHEAIAATADNPDATAEDLVAAREKADNARTDFDQANSPTTFTRAPDSAAPPPETKYTVNGLSYDPNEANRATAAQRQRNVETTRGAFGATGNTKYVNLAASLAASGLTPDKIAPIISAEMEKDNARTEKETEAEKTRVENAKEHSLNRDTQLEGHRIIGNAMVTAAGLRANPPAAQDTGTRGDLGYVQKIVRTAGQQYGIPKLIQQADAFNNAIAQLDTATGLGDAEALTDLIRANRGGVPNMSDYGQINAHVQGLFGKIKQAAQGAVNGQFSDEARANIRADIQALRTEMQQHVVSRASGFIKGVGSDPTLRNYAPVVNSAVRTLLQPLLPSGGEVPDVYATDASTPDPAALGEAQQRVHGARHAEKSRNADRAAQVKGKSTVKDRAQAALNDPEATPEEKAAAQRILGQ